MAETNHTPTTSTPEAETPTKLDKAVAFPTTRTLTAAEWIAIPNNPRQRDTDRHLLTAVHLRRPSPAHLQVNAALLPDGSLMKLDGHTRARLWELEPDRQPDYVLAALYAVGSRDEAEALYHHFDSKAAVDTASDDLSGAFNAAGFVPTSPYFRAYKGTSAIKTATLHMMQVSKTTGGLDIYQLVPKWLNQLQMIDALGITVQRFTGPILTAALLTVRRRGERAIEVLDRYQRDLGVKTGQEMDGVEALTRVLMAGTGRGLNTYRAVTARAIGCIEAAMAGRLITGPRVNSIPRYCTGMQREMECFSDLIDGLRKEVAARQRARTALRRLATKGQPRLPLLH